MSDIVGETERLGTAAQRLGDFLLEARVGVDDVPLFRRRLPGAGRRPGLGKRRFRLALSRRGFRLVPGRGFRLVFGRGGLRLVMGRG